MPCSACPIKVPCLSRFAAVMNRSKALARSALSGKLAAICAAMTYISRNWSIERCTLLCAMASRADNSAWLISANDSWLRKKSPMPAAMRCATSCSEKRLKKKRRRQSFFSEALWKSWRCKSNWEKNVLCSLICAARAGIPAWSSERDGL